MVTMNVNRPDLTLGIVGLGTMGIGIAQVAAQAGLELLLYDNNPSAAAAAHDAIRSSLRSARASAELQVVDTIEQLAPCHVIIEAIQEDLELKQKLFRSLEAVVDEECILASNTSSITITAIAAACRRPARVMCEGAGFRLGPFAMMDASGLDIVQAVSESIYDQYFHEPRFRPSFRVRQLVAAGLLGRKTGRGFYTYDGIAPRPMRIVPLPALRPASVWVSGADAERGAQVVDLVRTLGGTCEGSPRPTRGALCVVTPLGCDTTTSALAQGLDPTRTVAIDTLLGLRSRRTLMTNPLTDPAMRDAAHGLFGADAVPVSVIRDSPGFVAQRIVAMVVNVACDVAQQGIASPADVDCSYGQAYAKGPLTLGDEVGPRDILTVLENMFQFYGDPVYRPSPWLKRRAMLGVSLLSPDNTCTHCCPK